MFLKQTTFGFSEASVNIICSRLSFKPPLCINLVIFSHKLYHFTVNSRHWIDLCLWFKSFAKNIRIFLLYVTYCGCINAFLIFTERKAFNASHVVCGLLMELNHDNLKPSFLLTLSIYYFFDHMFPNFLLSGCLGSGIYGDLLK